MLIIRENAEGGGIHEKSLYFVLSCSINLKPKQKIYHEKEKGGKKS